MTDEQFRELRDAIHGVDRRLVAIETRLEGLDKRLDGMEDRTTREFARIPSEGFAYRAALTVNAGIAVVVGVLYASLRFFAVD